MSSIIPPTVPSSNLSQNSILPPGHNAEQMIPSPLDQYRLRLYNYAMVERIRSNQYAAAMATNSGRHLRHHHSNRLHHQGGEQLNSRASPCEQTAIGAAAISIPYGAATVAAAAAANQSRFALSMQFLHNRVFQPEEPKPQHSYIGLIAMAILNSSETKLVLSDIYQHILDNYPYFRSRGPGWRNSIRHNLSLNDCFIKAGRSVNGKGHYWAIHPANLEDFKKGDFRRRKAQRKVRKHMGLAVDDEGTDSQSPPPLCSTPTHGFQAVAAAVTGLSPFTAKSWAALAAVHGNTIFPIPLAQQPLIRLNPTNTDSRMTIIRATASKKRQFDVASLLAPDDQNLVRLTDTNTFGRNCTFNDSFNSLQNFNKMHQQYQPNFENTNDNLYQLNAVFGDGNYHYSNRSGTALAAAAALNSEYFSNDLRKTPDPEPENEDVVDVVANNASDHEHSDEDNFKNAISDDSNSNVESSTSKTDILVKKSKTNLIANEISTVDEKSKRVVNSNYINIQNIKIFSDESSSRKKVKTDYDNSILENSLMEARNNNEDVTGQSEFAVCGNEKIQKTWGKYDQGSINYQKAEPKFWLNKEICPTDETRLMDGRSLGSYYDKYITPNAQQRRQNNDTN